MNLATRERNVERIFRHQTQLLVVRSIYTVCPLQNWILNMVIAAVAAAALLRFPMNNLRFLIFLGNNIELFAA